MIDIKKHGSNSSCGVQKFVFLAENFYFILSFIFIFLDLGENTILKVTPP